MFIICIESLRVYDSSKVRKMHSIRLQFVLIIASLPSFKKALKESDTSRTMENIDVNGVSARKYNSLMSMCQSRGH